MSRAIVGLDVGGANLKGATADGQAATLPFPLWKQPGQLADALAELLRRLPPADEFAVTMTGELCDCFPHRRDGVRWILEAVGRVTSGRPWRVWSLTGEFLPPEAALAQPDAVASANWHALATFAGRFAPAGPALLIDIGSTTTDLIPLNAGRVQALGRNDFQRLQSGELVYVGVRRTPVCALLTEGIAAEFFATTRDVYLLRRSLAENPFDHDTADGRPATREAASARLARMLGADTEILNPQQILDLADRIHQAVRDRVVSAGRKRLTADQLATKGFTFITSGEGEFLAREVAHVLAAEAPVVALGELLSPAVSQAAPAYALAVLGAERRP